MILRSQLDCHEPGLPGEDKVFDLKARAVAPIRYNLDNYKNNNKYQIKRMTGLGSYEQEYYDMIRSVFIKYCFQARIGKMAGILVTYHNTSEIMGFQYITLSAMEQQVFGTSAFAEVSFKVITTLMNKLLDFITSKFPNETLRLLVHANRGTKNFDFYVERLGNSDSGWAEHNNIPVQEMYEQHVNTKNEVYKFTLKLSKELNGVPLTGPFKNYKSADDLIVNYEFIEPYTKLDVRNLKRDFKYALYSYYSPKKFE